MRIAKTAVISNLVGLCVVLAFGAADAGAAIEVPMAIPVPVQPRAGAAKATSNIHLPSGQNVGFNWYMNDGAGFRWDISSNGQVSDGTNDAYDGGMQLRIGGSRFSASSSQGVQSKDGREIEIGPWTQDSVRIWRRVYIDAKLGYARWIDIFENTSSSAQTIKVQYYSNLGGSIGTSTTTTGKQSVEKQDWGLVTADSSSSSRPATVHIFSNKGSRTKPSVRFNRGQDDLYVNFDLKLPAGKTVAICQYEAQRKSAADAIVFLKEFKPRRELDKVPASLRRIIVNMGGASLVMGNIDLPRHDKHDLAILRNEDELLGKILNERFDVETSFGKIELPALRVVGLSVPAPDDPYVQLVLLDGQMIAGKLLNAPLRLKLTNGNEMSLPPDKLKAATFALSPQRPSEIKITRPTVILRSGQQLAFRTGDLNMTFQTLYGNIELDDEDLVALELDTPDGGLHRAIFRNGSVLSGLLAAESLKLTLDLGPVLDSRRQIVSQFLFPGESADPAGLCEITLLNEDVLFGHLADESLAITTQYGKVTVSPANVAELVTSQEAAVGQVVIKLHNGTSVTGKLVGETILFQTEPGPKLPIFIGHIVKITNPPTKGQATTAPTTAAGPGTPPPPKPSSEPGSTTTPPTPAVDPRTKARANEAASQALKLKQLSAELKRVLATQESLAGQVKALMKLEQSEEVKKNLKDTAKTQALYARRADEIRKNIAEIQKAMLQSIRIR